MDKNPKFSNDEANKYYSSLTSEKSGDLNSFAGRVQLMPGTVKSFKDIKYTLHPENFLVSVKDTLNDISERLGVSLEDAIFDPRTVDLISESELNLIKKVESFFVIGLINTQPESLQTTAEISINIIDKIVQQLSEIANYEIEPPEIGEVMGSDKYNERIQRNSAISRSSESLNYLSMQDLISRTKFKLGRNSDVIMNLEIPKNTQDSQAAVQLLNDIINGGYSLQDFYDWQSALPKLHIAGEKGGIGGNGGEQEEELRGQRRDILHEGRIEFIAKLGDALLNKDLPWNKFISDVKVFSTNFSPDSAYGINYIALSCQFEYKPGQQIEITVLERPSRQGIIDLDTGDVTAGREQNATYVYVSRAPKAWMEVFNESRPSGARNYDYLGRTTEVPSEPAPMPIGRASYLKHVDFSEFDNLQNKEEILQKHLDKLVNVILTQVREIQSNARA